MPTVGPASRERTVTRSSPAMPSAEPPLSLRVFARLRNLKSVRSPSSRLSSSACRVMFTELLSTSGVSGLFVSGDWARPVRAHLSSSSTVDRLSIPSGPCLESCRVWKSASAALSVQFSRGTLRGKPHIYIYIYIYIIYIYIYMYDVCIYIYIYIYIYVSCLIIIIIPEYDQDNAKL